VQCYVLPLKFRAAKVFLYGRELFHYGKNGRLECWKSLTESVRDVIGEIKHIAQNFQAKCPYLPPGMYNLREKIKVSPKYLHPGR